MTCFLNIAFFYALSWQFPYSRYFASVPLLALLSPHKKSSRNHYFNIWDLIHLSQRKLLPELLLKRVVSQICSLSTINALSFVKQSSPFANSSLQLRSPNWRYLHIDTGFTHWPQETHTRALWWIWSAECSWYAYSSSLLQQSLGTITMMT